MYVGIFSELSFLNNLKTIAIISDTVAIHAQSGPREQRTKGITNIKKWRRVGEGKVIKI